MNYMSSYKKQYYQLKLLLEQQSERDRLLLLVAWVLGFLGLWFFIFYEPIVEQHSAVVVNNERMQKQITELNQKRRIIESTASNPNTANLIDRYNLLLVKIQEMDTQYKRYNERYISQKDLSRLVHDMLKTTSGITLVDFSTIPQDRVEPVSPKPNASSSTVPPKAVAMISQQYRLIIQGTYFPVMNYLKQLEDLRWNLYWDKFQYKVETYPKGIITLEFYTLKQESEQLKSS
jgi:MSHA biogenesis protein MshJ